MVLVGGVICLVNSDNKRDSLMLNSYATPKQSVSYFLEGQVAYGHMGLSNNRHGEELGVEEKWTMVFQRKWCGIPLEEVEMTPYDLLDVDVDGM
eukprot:g30924.t1